MRLELKLPSGLLRGRKRPPEDSIALRAWVLAAILVGEVAVLTSGYFDVVTGILVPLLTVVAFTVSHYRRREKNYLIKATLAVFFREALEVTLRHAGSAREAIFVDTGDTRLRSARAQGSRVLAP